MSLTRRLAAGLPAAGVIAFAALAFTGTPALATGDGAARAGHPAVMATPITTTTAADDGYGGGNQGGHNGENPNENPTDDTRGHAGYGSESPTSTPSETPTGTTDTVPPTATAPPTGTTDTVPPGGQSAAAVPRGPEAPGGGVSAGGTLPLTGTPMGATLGLGALMVAAGGAAVWYSRRRRTA